MTTINATALAQDNYSTKIQDLYPAHYYLALKSTDFNKWKERWECMLWEEPKDEYTHLPFEDFPESEANDRGKFFKLNESDLHNPIKASEEEIEEANVWVLPGALSTSRNEMSSTLEDIKTFFCDNNCHLWHGNALIFCPYSTGEKRYEEAIEYNNNTVEYFSPKIEKFVRKYFIPRLIREKKLAFIVMTPEK